MYNKRLSALRFMYVRQVVAQLCFAILLARGRHCGAKRAIR